MAETTIQQDVKYNFVANSLDGGFFGFALGLASFITVLPLFVSTLTSSALIIGLIPAIHSVGWQLPQLLTAYGVSKQPRYKPMVMRLTIHERLPFLFLALVVWLSPRFGTQVTLVLTFGLLIWQGLGGGFTATAWQSMIGKIFPSSIRGTFFGSQAAAANLMASIAAVLAGLILERMLSPQDFTMIFILAGLSMLISWGFLALTREPSSPLNVTTDSRSEFRSRLWIIVKRDRDFRWFIVARMIAHFGTMAFAFYTVYAVGVHHVSESSVGVMTAVFMGIQIIANPLMGYLGDRWSYRMVMVLGMLAASMSSLLAWWAPTPYAFYIVFALAGIGNVALWTIGLSMILEYGIPKERPAYIGLSNTLIAPATIFAPLLAGWIVDNSGYPIAFLVSAIFGILAAFVFSGMVKDKPRLAMTPIDG